MVSATSSHTTNPAAINQSTPSSPAICNSQPPSAPPRNAPKNWEVEYTPIAVPLLAAGASLLISEGRLASSKLKAIKKEKHHNPGEDKASGHFGQPRRRHSQERNSATEHRLHHAFFLANNDKGHHGKKRGDHHTQVKPPVRAAGKPELILQYRRKHQKQRSEHQVQSENAKIES